MFEEFLRIDKGVFKIGLSADEIIILAKIMEFHYQTGKIFVSNETFAELSGCSIRTVDRKIKHLEELGLIKRDTKVTQKGKDRKIYFNESKYFELVNGKQEESANDKMTNAEMTNCHLPNRQNDSIKENNEKIIEKENNATELTAKAVNPTQTPEVEVVRKEVALEQAKAMWGNTFIVDENGYIVFATDGINARLNGKFKIAS